jgi:hypothetical protein
MRQREAAGDAPAHRQADDVRLPFAQVIQDAQQVVGEVLEAQRPVVVLRVAVAACIPRGCLELPREELQLRMPVRPVAADAVQEDDERAAARNAQRDARRTGDQDGFQAYSTLAPEILTACARFSLSFLM